MSTTAVKLSVFLSFLKKINSTKHRTLVSIKSPHNFATSKRHISLKVVSYHVTVLRTNSNYISNTLSRSIRRLQRVRVNFF